LEHHIIEFSRAAKVGLSFSSLKCSTAVIHKCQRLSNAVEFISFGFPKMHSLAHLVDIIRRKGPTDGYHTGIGESGHRQKKKDYKRTNSHQGFELQVRVPFLMF
jgi:hypothetical protein